jgi:O-acetyl-ADP-ribose deacetylase (regulator of RNase III)
MIKFKTGNILQANTEALVNTVNCEGYMGKGIAYQFKKQFPSNNDAYVKACKSGELAIGNVFPFKEDGKIILNFPTKNKWRENSKYEYIKKGLISLHSIINKFSIKSIAIPPLGCGNGGLQWDRVKEILSSELNNLNNVEVIIFEPSENLQVSTLSKNLPKLNTSHLVLMQLKLKLKKFTKIRLQKTAFLLNYLSSQNYFRFEKYTFGPYAHSLEILSKDIKEYQDYFGFSTEQAYKYAKETLISDSIITKENFLSQYLNKATDFVNKIQTDKELELLTTILYIVQTSYPINEEEVSAAFLKWSERKAGFSQKEINTEIEKLLKQNLLRKELYGLAPIS